MSFEEEDSTARAIDFDSQLDEELKELFNIQNGSADRYKKAHERRIVGLAFSGGGIRSATFNLGIIQGLAKKHLLHRVDYLSTVSGGGYIGAWLADLVCEAKEKDVCEIESQLRRSDLQSKSAQQKADDQDSIAGAEGERSKVDVQDAIAWLRSYSNYLTPRTGPLSLDTLQGIATVGRNIFLNQLTLVAFLSLLLLLPWALALDWHSLLEAYGHARLIFVGGLVTLAAGAGILGTGSATVAGNQRTVPLSSLIVPSFALASLLIGGAFPVYWRQSATERSLEWLAPTAILAVGYAVAWLAGWIWGGRSNRALWRHSVWPVAGAAGAAAGLALFSLAYGLLLGWLADGAGVKPVSHEAANVWSLHVTVLGMPVILTAILLTMAIHLGIAGRALPESLREWWGRLGGALLRVIIAWLALASAAIYSPYWIEMLGSWAAAGGLAWAATAVAGALAGANPKTGNTQDGNPWLDRFARIAPLIFVVGLMFAISYGVYRASGHALNAFCPLQVAAPRTNEDPLKHRAYEVELRLGERTALPTGGTIYELRPDHYRFQTYATKFHDTFTDRCLDWLPLGVCGALIALMFIACVCRSLVWLSNRRVDINYFSLHMFYRNRLARCYLGAWRTRKSDDHSQLESDDQRPLSELATRPFNIFNATLNVTESDNLAWQERKAASFTFTPLYCGYEFSDPTSGTVAAYRKTDEFGKQSHAAQGSGDCIRLAGPMTISGAALSPNRGYHTSPATAFLMTMFNVRLGWWLPNPQKKELWRTIGPERGFRLLLRELLARSDSSSDYVYLSDGGNFENLAIYELVRRRCRYIVACDAGCDRDFKFEDLGNAIRKIRIDLDIEIEIDARPVVPDPTTGQSLYHCVVGKIRYDRSDGDTAPTGYLLYIKPTLCGAEPGDVTQYAAANPSFPHETTTDQWFGESQFEAYRKLGEHILEKILADCPQEGEATQIEPLFRRLHERWYPPPRVAAKGVFSKHGGAVNSLFNRLSQGGSLSFLDRQFYPQWPHLAPASENKSFPPIPTSAEDIRACFYFCNELLQLMENVYLDLNLETECDHPDNRGWMNLFHNWSWSPMLRVSWSINAGCYGARFQAFCERKLKMLINDIVISDAHSLQSIIDGARPDVSNPKSFINPVEWDILKGLHDKIEPSLSKTLGVVVLSLQVSDPLSPQTKIFRFPVGLAVICKTTSELKFFRIQDHLQQMGFGRKGLHALKEQDPELKLALLELVSKADSSRLRGLWNTV